MTGPEHYRQAEACLDHARSAMLSVVDAGASEAAVGAPIVAHLMAVAALHAAMAQAHATLALVQATLDVAQTTGGGSWPNQLSWPS